MKRSAGVLFYRRTGGALEVLLIHPGGPYWLRQDRGAWQIPKGELGPDEEPEAAARREAAEELGVTRDNAGQLADQSRSPAVRRLLGTEGEVGPMLGLRKDWAKAAIEAEGNYGEIFARNVGADSPLDLARGLNAQWNTTPGGLIYALPIR